MRLLLLLVLAGVFAGSAGAVPDEFRESARLQPVAGMVAPGAVVLCGTDNNSWATDVAARFGVQNWSQFAGYNIRGTHEARLSPTTCMFTEGWLRGKNVPALPDLASAVLTLVHELAHVRGVQDESAADCAALRQMPRVLTVHFKVRRAVTLRAIMAAAWADHRHKPPAYRTSC